MGGEVGRLRRIAASARDGPGRRAEGDGSFEKFSDSFVPDRDDSLPPITRIIVAVIGYTGPAGRVRLCRARGRHLCCNRDQLQIRKGEGGG